MRKYDLAVRWADGRSGLARVRKLGGITVSGYPQYFRVPGGNVAIVLKGGVVALRFRAARVNGPRMVQLAGGQRRRGYVIKAERSSIRPPTAREKRKVGIRWYAVGQFRYLNLRTGKAVLIDPSSWGDKDYLQDEEVIAQKVSFRGFNGGIPGCHQDHPEARLVARYVKWLNDPQGFGHNYIREAGLFVDLFDRRKWRLIEAKSSDGREIVRMAVGQLLDYRRFYNRHPSLAVLVPRKPSAACLGFLQANHIVAVWETARGRFNDSTDAGLWTAQRRH